MFDFVNYTFSGILSIIATLFAMSYPLIIGCIEKIDSKYHSNIISERFCNEWIFKSFKIILIINLVTAVILPFLMDGNNNCRIYIGIQCALAILLVSNSFLLFSKIMSYNSINELSNNIKQDYSKAVQKGEKNKEENYFAQWIDLTPVLLSSPEDKTVQSIYTFLDEYTDRKKQESSAKRLTFDTYFYDGISRINEEYCKREKRPISVNNTNTLLTRLLRYTNITDTTYRYIWWNLRIQLYYNQDEWIMEYWKAASNIMELQMREIYQYEVNYETGEEYTSTEVKERADQRNQFLDFHIMLCSMLAQSKKYNLLKMMLNFTDTEPPSYPLIPSKLSEIIVAFNRINSNIENTPWYYEDKFQMPNMHGITQGKILGAANSFLSLLVFRLYTIRWDYGYDHTINTPTLPNTLYDLAELDEQLSILRFWLNRNSKNQDLLSIIDVENFETTLKELQENYKEAKAPGDVIKDIQEAIQEKEKEIKTEQDLEPQEIGNKIKELTDSLTSGLKRIDIFLEGKFNNQKKINLDSSISMSFPNTAFLSDPDISVANVSGCMSEYILRHFYHLLAWSFFKQECKHTYHIGSEEVFNSLDRLNLNSSHYIIAFGLYLDYYVDKVDGLCKENEYTYKYHKTTILLLNCPTKIFSKRIYILKKSDCPYVKIVSPNAEILETYQSNQVNKKYNLWMSIVKLNDHPKLLNEKIKKDLGDKVNQYSLFTCFFKPEIHFNPESFDMIQIQVKYKLNDEGQIDELDKLQPFDS